MKYLLKALVFGLVAVVAAVPARAVELAQVSESHSNLAVHSEVTSVAPGQQFWLAVTITPRPGWHTYWKNSGDSGAAPIFDWTADGETRFGEPRFPTPKRLPLGPLVNYGYDAPVSYLVPVTAPENGTSLQATFEAEWLICEIECVPQLADLEVEVPLGETERDKAATGLFQAARSAMPDPSYWSAALEVSRDGSILKIFMTEEEASDIVNAYFFPSSVGVLDYAASQSLEASPDGLLVKATRPTGAPDVTSAAGVVTLDFANGETLSFEMDPSLEIVAGQSDGASQGMPAPAPLSLLQAAIFALLGGLVLNLMPCVFPVLSLKAFAFISANYKTPANRQKEGWAYTAGIWVSFMAIVISLLALRAGGTAVGWGFQLQEPVFVGLMTILMMVVALSLSGMFNIQFGIEGAGQSLASREGARGAFFKGVLAALVATPCTAPFMAPAIGFALTQPVAIVLLVFSFLAFGLALPFLALSYSPALGRIMPRPGPWMEKVKEGLAFPMYLTAAWLLYVFTRETGAVAMLILLAAIIGVVFALWIGNQASGRMPLKVFAWAVAALSIYGVASQPWVEPAHTVGEGYVKEVVYSPSALNDLLDKETPVFVYFTADWCITCKVNERIAIRTDASQQAFRDTGTVVMKGDWTNRNAEIAAVLARHGRAGVPLYLYYPKGAKEPIVLPEILGPGSISNLIATSQGDR